MSAGLKAKLKINKGKREAILAKMNNYYEESRKVAPTETRNTDEFISHTATIDALYKQYNELLDEHNLLSMEKDSQFEPNYTEWSNFETIYSHVVQTRSNLLEVRRLSTMTTLQSSAGAPRASESTFTTKLPPIVLPSFDGMPKNWALFYESFKTNIHTNTQLNNSQRVQYLVGKLSGRALGVFAGVIPSEENYLTIWNALVEKYQDKRALGTLYLNNIIDVKPVPANSVQMNNFVEHFASSISAVKQLGIDDLVDFIFLHLALKKLDSQVIQSFELTVREKNIPSCSDLLGFIRHQVKMLERTSLNSSNLRSPSHTLASSSPRQVDSNQNRWRAAAHSFAITTHNTSLQCTLCKRFGHTQIYKCQKFLNMSIKGRQEYVKNNKNCFNCLSSMHSRSECNSQSRCRSCNQKHHSLLHESTFTKEPALSRVQDGERPAASIAGPADPITLHTRARAPETLVRNINGNNEVLLSTARVYAVGSDGTKQTIRCLIDSASQNNIITIACCKKLRLKPITLNNSSIKTVGSISTPVHGYVFLTIQSRISQDKYNIKLIVVENITEKLPTRHIDLSAMGHVTGLALADDTWHIPGEVDAILGAQLFPYLLLSGRAAPSPSLDPITIPPALETTLGYVIVGELPTIANSANAAWSFGPITDDVLNYNLNKFWQLEELPAQHHEAPDDAECERLYRSTVSRHSSGRYVVALPFKGDPSSLGNSHVIARRRFASLERKFRANSELHQAYSNVISEYIEKGYLRVAPYSAATFQEGYFIPHHAVVRPDKSTTKTRIVLDASAQTDTGLSLNDILHVGPNLQANLFTLLLNFRLFAIAMSADVQQMYLRIMVTEEHRKYQRILFRFNETEPIRIFEFNSVAFGLRSSPYLAMRTIRQLAADEGERFPHAASAATRELYMDDLTTSVRSVQEGIGMSSELLAMFKCGGFDLVKWSSNSRDLLLNVPESHRAAVTFSDGDNLKVLGLKWLPQSDVFTFTTLTEDRGCTKRIILSTLARLFDVLGLVAPVILYAKLLIQELWLAKLNWDEELPHSFATRFAQFKEELPLLAELKIPRHLGVADGSVVNIIAFGDASLRAYGCVVYLHVTNSTGNVSLNLVCSKSRVAPLKTISLARLELCAALILSQLVRHVFTAYNDRFHINDIFAFSDSTVALSWIHSSPHRWQIFVANRVSKIQENIAPERFFHIDGVENPSDCISRGLLPSQLIDHPLWWRGPLWAHRPTAEWPIKPFSSTKQTDAIPELRKSVTLAVVSVTDDSPIYDLALRISSWSKLLRIIVYILRAAGKIARPTSVLVQPSEIEAAENVILLVIQRIYFNLEINLVKANKLPSPGLRKLVPFLDKRGLLRVGGRLSSSNIPFENRHPVLLPRRDHVVNLIIDHFHRVNCHTGSYLLMSLLRQRYWIISARNMIRQRVRACNYCFKISPSSPSPMMADLPRARVQEAKAFTHTGVDYAGPINITITRRRGIKSQKAYICLFVCLTTKAIHIELVSCLSADSFLDAFKRFLSRRGPVSCIYSDNGTNFVGARAQLDKMYDFLSSKETRTLIQNELTNRRIVWKTIPPRAPHFGGMWEANIRSVKTHLYRVIGKQLLSYEEMFTVLTQIECLLNSRPLCLLSDTPQPEVLTPAHFLMSTPLQFLPAYDVQNESVHLRDRHKLLDNLVKSYWKRWHLEYLHTLQTRQKWNAPSVPVTVGTLVLIRQDDTPPLRWPTGIIEEVYPGKDGIIRVVLVRTPAGTFKRPVVKLCPIPSQ